MPAQAPRAKLHPKHVLFVMEYLKDFNATQAAARAGYTGSQRSLSATGSTLLASVNVSAEVAKRLRTRFDKADINAQLVLEGLLSEARYFGEGSTHAARVTAWRALGDHLKMFNQKIEHVHEHAGEVILRIGNLSADERTARAGAILSRATKLLTTEIIEGTAVDVTDPGRDQRATPVQTEAEGGDDGPRETPSRAERVSRLAEAARR